MSQLTSEQKEFSILGLLVGLLVALRLYVTTGTGMAFIGLIGCTLGGYALGFWLSDSESERPKFFAMYAVLGVMVGIFIGVAQLKMQGAEILEAALIGGVVYGLGLGSIALFLKAANSYLSFKGEIYMVTLLGTVGALGGSFIADFLEKNKFTHFIPGSFEHTAANIVFITVGSILLSITLGMMFSANRTRPMVGAVCTLVAGALVLWFGISLTSILFMPGSGLYWAGYIVGLVLISLGFLIMVFPESHTYMGIAIIIFSILSYVGAAGGLIVGGLFGLLGGTLIFAWTGADNPVPSQEGQ